MPTKKPSAALPSRVWVGSYEFIVKVVAPEDPVLLGDVEPGATPEEAHGITIFEDGKHAIYIASNLPTLHRLEVLLHELTHAVNWANDIEDGAEEELIAAKHGRAWSQFYLDNPRFVAWLVFTVNRVRKERTSASDETKVTDEKAAT